MQELKERKEREQAVAAVAAVKPRPRGSKAAEETWAENEGWEQWEASDGGESQSQLHEPSFQAGMKAAMQVIHLLRV
jgi:hypothetical protein